MSLVGLSSAAAGEIIIWSGAFTIIGLIIVHGHKWITAWAELRKTRKDDRRPSDDRSLDGRVQDQRPAGGAYPDSQPLHRTPLPLPDREHPDIERVPDHGAATGDGQVPPPAEEVHPFNRPRSLLLGKPSQGVNAPLARSGGDDSFA
jgi:hypothetical protein